MSDKDSKNKKEAVYFLDVDIHKKYLMAAKEDKQVAIYHLHDYTAPDLYMKNPPDLIGDLCRYVMVLDRFIALMDRVSEYPIPEDRHREDGYVFFQKDALLLKHYIPMMEECEFLMSKYGLSMVIN
jgi:hypothetical protein